jgi:hypothetical protein
LTIPVLPNERLRELLNRRQCGGVLPEGDWLGWSRLYLLPRRRRRRIQQVSIFLPPSLIMSKLNTQKLSP